MCFYSRTFKHTYLGFPKLRETFSLPYAANRNFYHLWFEHNLVARLRKTEALHVFVNL